MPVPRSRRYDSEYASHYKTFEARRPKVVKGEPVRSLSHHNIHGNGSTPRAGLQSSQLGTIHEPPLQRKKIVPYDKNHNIFRTVTTKEDRDQEWLKSDEVSSLGSHSSRQKHNKEGRNTNSKTFILKRGETPILAAERKVFKEQQRNGRNHQASATYVPDRIKRRSTYKDDFVNYKKHSIKTSKPRSNRKNNQRKSPHKVVGGKKDVSPDRLPPAGVRSTTSFGDARLLHPSDDSTYMRSPERKQPKASKVLDSEYRSHFTQPTKFKYVNGMWVETPVGTTGGNEAKHNFEDGKQQATPDWFKQVLERRHEAYGYSHNSRGTHFSRESLNEMNREQAERESARSESQNSQFSPRERSKDRRVKGTLEEKFDRPPMRREAWEEIKPRSPKEPPVNVHPNSGTEEISDDEEMVFLERGRSPTPELRDTKDSRRHHLDVTTNILNDSFHKALNLSKNGNDSPSSGHRKATLQNREMSLEGGKSTSPASSVDMGGEAGTDARKAHVRRLQAAEKVELSPPSNGRDSPSSIVDGRDNGLNPLPRRQVSHAAKVSPPDSGRYSPASSMGGRDEDDVLSVSAMSSRASTASETLERAKKRRDEFWKGGIAAR